MGKKLSEMTLEELWQLFPIYLTEHQPNWQEYCMGIDIDKGRTSIHRFCVVR